MGQMEIQNMDAEVKKWEKFVYHAAHRCKLNVIPFEDRVQYGFLGLVKALGNLDTEKFNEYQQKSWLYKQIWAHIMEASKRYYRKTKMETSMETSVGGSSSDSEGGTTLETFLGTEDETATSAYDRTLLKGALLKLAPKEREALELYYFKQMRYTEIAPIVGMSAPGVRMMILRTVETIRRATQNTSKSVEENITEEHVRGGAGKKRDLTHRILDGIHGKKFDLWTIDKELVESFDELGVAWDHVRMLKATTVPQIKCKRIPKAKLEEF